jgi:hypothetical protein
MKVRGTTMVSNEFSDNLDQDTEDWSVVGDKAYHDPEEPVVEVDRETGERYIINPAGTKIYCHE